MRAQHPISPLDVPAKALSCSALLLAGFLLLHAPAHASVVTTFDTGTEGWLVTGDNASGWNPAGGNPGGCFGVNDLATGATNLAVAPAAFLGDWLAMTPADSITADFYFHRLSGSITPPAYLFRIAGPGGSAHTLAGFVPAQDVWTTVSAPLDSTAWVIESGTWSAIRAHVSSLRVYAEFVTGYEEVRLDNIRLTGAVTDVFEPCLFETFSVAGLGDWSFGGTGGVSNPGDLGNGGGFCQVQDGTGTSYAFAPGRFLGDWSALDGSGRLSIDLRLVSITGPTMEVPEFIRLSGPGGVARIGLVSADISTAPMIWKRHGFPLEESAWTLVSGTWGDLLQNVTECRIQAEFAAGTEVVGIDNFGRLSAGCPDPDQTVVVHAAGFERCGEQSFVNIGAIARNPADGELYGLVDLGSGSGGGLYPVTGAGAGVRLQAYATPAGLIFDTAGNAYVAEDTGGSVFRYSGGVSSVWASGFHSGDDDPTGMCVAPPGFDGPNVDPGDLLVTDPGFSGADEVWSFKTTAPEGELQVVADLAGNPQYQDIATGPDGVVYTVTTTDPGNLYVISPNGVLTAIPISTPLTGMLSLVYDPSSERVFVAETGGGTLRSIDPGTGDVELIASGFVDFNDCAVEIDEAEGVLHVADAGMHRVYRICLPDVVSVPSREGRSTQGDVTSLVVYPNPTRGASRVSWSQSRRAEARITIHDVAGRIVRRVAPGVHESGVSTWTWDGRGDGGGRMATGFYLVRVETDLGSRASGVFLLK